MIKLVWRTYKTSVKQVFDLYLFALLGYATYGISISKDSPIFVLSISTLFLLTALISHFLMVSGEILIFSLTFRFRRFSRYTLERTYCDGTKKRYVLTMPRWVDNLAFEDQKRVIFAQVKGQ